MPMLKQRSVLLAKIESTYNTDPTPTGANDAVYAEDLQLSWPNEVIDPNPIRSTLSPDNPLQGRKLGRLTFMTPLKGSGAAGTAPDWAPLLRACGFGETVVASTSVTYAPVSSSMDSVTLYAYRDGLLYKFTGCRGTARIVFPVGQRAMLEFEFTGHAVDVVDAALATPTVDATVPQIVTGSSFTIGAYAAIIANLNIDMQNNVVAADDLNGSDGYGEIVIAGRNTSGSFDPEAKLVATHDFWSDWEDGTSQALTIAVGGTAGNIATFTGAQLVNRELSEGERNGILTYEIPFTCAYNGGDDEVSLALT